MIAQHSLAICHGTFFWRTVQCSLFWYRTCPPPAAHTQINGLVGKRPTLSCTCPPAHAALPFAVVLPLPHLTLRGETLRFLVPPNAADKVELSSHVDDPDVLCCNIMTCDPDIVGELLERQEDFPKYFNRANEKAMAQLGEHLWLLLLLGTFCVWSNGRHAHSNRTGTSHHSMTPKCSVCGALGAVEVIRGRQHIPKSPLAPTSNNQTCAKQAGPGLPRV